MKRYPAWILALLIALPAWSSGAVIGSAAPQPEMAPAAKVLPSLDTLKSRFFTGAPSADKDAELPAVGKASPKRPVVSSSASAPVHVEARSAPDFSFTPGKLCTPSDPDFKEYRYPEHIAYCNRHVTKEMKQQVAAHYGVPESEWQNYEFDHLIPLCAGGNSHIENLWPEPRGDTESDGKDKLELQLYKEMSAGTITQAEAVRQTYAWFDGK